MHQGVQVNSELYSASPSCICLAQSYTLVMNSLHFARMLKLEGFLHFLLLSPYDGLTN